MTEFYFNNRIQSVLRKPFTTKSIALCQHETELKRKADSFQTVWNRSEEACERIMFGGKLTGNGSVIQRANWLRLESVKKEVLERV